MKLEFWKFLFWCHLSGLQEELGQHNGSCSCGRDLLQVMLRQEIWAQRLRLRGRSRDSEHGQRRRTWNQAWTVRAAALPLVISTAETKVNHTKTDVLPSQVSSSLPVLDFPLLSLFLQTDKLLTVRQITPTPQSLPREPKAQTFVQDARGRCTRRRSVSEPGRY